MVKIVAISDTHMAHRDLYRLVKGDILVHCGDLTHRGRSHEYADVLEFFRLHCARYKHVIFIAGNHDFGCKEYMDNMLQCGMFPDNLHYLHNESKEIMGIKFFGSPNTPPFYDWAYMSNEGELSNIYSLIPKDTQVLITHGPAFGILDVESRNGEHCGSTSLLRAIVDLDNLKHHLFGHIHASNGQQESQNVTFSNCSVLDDNYDMKFKPTVIKV